MDQQHIETITSWYEAYRSKHGKPPPNEQAFIEFIQAEQKARGVPVDVEKLMTSPRDGKRYVVIYKPNSPNRDRNVVVHEQEGHDGKKWMAFENRWSQEVDQAKLDELKTIK